tara:strand:+ start:7160 stop:7699 length:540 start_codon:yes stop_codon:yes gene_type:complete
MATNRKHTRQELQNNLVASKGQFINRRTEQPVPAGTPYHIHPDKGPMEGAVHNSNISGGQAGHDFFDEVMKGDKNPRKFTEDASVSSNPQILENELQLKDTKHSITDNGGGSRSYIFEECEYLPFDENSFVWNQYELCYGLSMYQDMADGSSSFVLGELVGPETFGNPKVVVILFQTPW